MSEESRDLEEALAPCTREAGRIVHSHIRNWLKHSGRVDTDQTVETPCLGSLECGTIGQVVRSSLLNVRPRFSEQLFQLIDQIHKLTYEADNDFP